MPWVACCKKHSEEGAVLTPQSLARSTLCLVSREPKDSSSYLLQTDRDIDRRRRTSQSTKRED